MKSFKKNQRPKARLMNNLITIRLLLIATCTINLFSCSTIETTKIVANNPTQAETQRTKRAPAAHSWGTYHWARTTPQFTLKVGDNLTVGTWKNLLSQTSIDWNSPEIFGATSTPVLTAIVAGGSAKNRCSMVTGTAQVCNGKYGNNGWLGLASINIVNGEHISQGTAKMNDSYFTTAKYNNPNEKLHVMCQEVAHVFGLDHQSVDGSSQNSCMDYFSNTDTNATSTLSTRPNAHDFDQLNLIYSTPDATTTVAPLTTVVSVSETSDNPNSWGQFMRNQSRGQSAYYERSNQDGSITITHVYWTQETANRCKDCDHRDHN